MRIDNELDITFIKLNQFHVLLGRQELLATSSFLYCGRTDGEVLSPKFCVFVDYDLTLVPIGSIVFLWVPIGSYGFLWVPIGSYGFLWVPMGSYVFLWHSVVNCFKWCIN